MKSRFEPSMGASKKTLLAAMAVVALLAAVGTASAMAAPKGEWVVFAQCPTSNPELSGCIVSRTESGEFKIGKETVPIKNVQTLQGGFIEEPGGAQKFVGAADGNTLSKTPQKVPGGLAGLIKCSEIAGGGLLEKAARAACELIFENAVTGVNATTELAVPATSIGINEENLLTQTGTALTLPIKVKLENPLLGNECYIGSNTNPITLNLTTGTTKPMPPNEPISGKLGTFSSRAEFRILVDTNNTLVDNAFAAPAATGCGGIFSALITPVVNGKLGLPSAGGTNTAILTGTFEQTGIEAARESE
jgi:hypothetical protein